MKLAPALLAGFTGASIHGLQPLQAISMAHSRVRNGFTLPEMDMITEGNERLLAEVFFGRILKPIHDLGRDGFQK